MFVVEICSLFLHMLVSFIYTIQHLVHPRLVGVPQSLQSNECLEEAVHHMALVEEKSIIDECLDPPVKVIFQS